MIVLFSFKEFLYFLQLLYIQSALVLVHPLSDFSSFTSIAIILQHQILIHCISHFQCIQISQTLLLLVLRNHSTYGTRRTSTFLAIFLFSIHLQIIRCVFSIFLVVIFVCFVNGSSYLNGFLFFNSFSSL